jgi:16S rRNA (uracil1498-N3)-methyltransferase
MRAGDEVFVFDGCGNEYRCRVLDEREKRARLEIIDRLTDIVESPLRLTLAQSLAKGEKFDFIVQKATELGVSRIVPLASDHADVRLSEEQAEKRVDRWKRISLEALKQCGRRTLVEIAAPVTVGSLLGCGRAESSELFLVFSERGGALIRSVIQEMSLPSSVTVLIGPEGGWSDDEHALFEKLGAREVSLGSRILRTETAALASITLIQHLIGDLSNST